MTMLKDGPFFAIVTSRSIGRKECYANSYLDAVTFARQIAKNEAKNGEQVKYRIFQETMRNVVFSGSVVVNN